MTPTPRRAVLQAAAALAASCVPVARAGEPRIEKGLVKYQDKPRDGAECGGCLNWSAPAACKVVAGAISAQGWCVAFAPKED